MIEYMFISIFSIKSYKLNSLNLKDQNVNLDIYTLEFTYYSIY